MQGCLSFGTGDSDVSQVAVLAQYLTELSFTCLLDWR
jgi:hypothetical protein